MNMKSKKEVSTYERLMQNPEFAQALEEESAKLHMSEILIELMDKNAISVRKLADKAHISPAVVQGIRSGTRKNASITSVANIFRALGYDLVLKNQKEEFALT